MAQVSTKVSRAEVLKEIKEALGIVPGFFSGLPDDVLAHEWEVYKRTELGETRIPNKYKELIGLAVAAVLHCQYCILIHTEAARLFGATEEEIQETLRMAKLTIGWSTYLNGSQYDFNVFKDEVKKISSYVKGQMRG